MLVSLLSLGCPKNLADSENLLRRLSAGGVGLTEDPNEAEVMLVNTCGFVEDAKRESVEEILNLAELKRDGKRLLVFGCLAQRYREELRKEIPEIDAIFGVGEEEGIVRCLTGRSASPTPLSGPLMRANRYVLPVKVAEGCNRRCTFCAIPSIRGPERSRPPDEVLGEAEAYISSGARELMLVAQELTAYDWRGYGPASLIRDMASISGDFWIRPLYLYPTGVEDGLIQAMAEEKKVVKYVDIPLQHSEDRLLRAMGRDGTREGYMGLIRRIREAMPGAALRTAFIVGFPGERGEDFAGLMDFVEEVGFDRLGVFMYSKEEGTPAARMGGHLPRRVKEERLDGIMRLQADISRRKNRTLVGQRTRALVDAVEGDVALARLAGQAREIDGLTYIRGIEGRGLGEGDFVEVEIVSAHDYDLEGVCL